MFSNLYNRMKDKRERFILSATSNLRDKPVKVLVLGGCEGVFLDKIRKELSIKEIYTVEINNDYVYKLRQNPDNIVAKADLNQRFPYGEDLFDLIVADQVIEHIVDIDAFLLEIFRVLKKGGWAIISTENLASFANIASLIMGYRPFSMHYSYRKNIGNPFSPHNNEEYSGKNEIGAIHHKIFTPRSLKEMLKLYNFNIKKEFYNGFLPLPDFFSKIFRKHSFFMTFLITK